MKRVLKEIKLQRGNRRNNANSVGCNNSGVINISCGNDNVCVRRRWNNK